MPKKTPYKSKPEFYETLAPSMAFSPALERTNSVSSTPLWVYPAWIGGSIILGVLIGFAVKDLNQAPILAVTPGNVAQIPNTEFGSIAKSQSLAQVQNQTIQGNSRSLQAESTSLQNGKNIDNYQYSYNTYGIQGGVSVNYPE